VFGRKGFFFCTEDIDKCCTHKVGDTSSPFIHTDIDDENDAARILQKVLGDPPRNVVYKRYGEESSLFGGEKGMPELDTQETSATVEQGTSQEASLHKRTLNVETV